MLNLTTAPHLMRSDVCEPGALKQLQRSGRGRTQRLGLVFGFTRHQGADMQRLSMPSLPHLLIQKRHCSHREGGDHPGARTCRTAMAIAIAGPCLTPFPCHARSCMPAILHPDAGNKHCNPVLIRGDAPPTFLGCF